MASLLDRDKVLMPSEQHELYILIHDGHYTYFYGWRKGMLLKRISIWAPGNGCGVRQALFMPADGGNDRTAWEDHVKPLIGQLTLF